jgi:predicted Zn-dependent peptidase
MGCDFYTYYVLHIEYNKGEKTKKKEYILEDTRKRHYFYGDYSRDEDFEEYDDYIERIRKAEKEEINTALLKYKKAELFKNNHWLCIPSAQEKYKNILEELNIAESSLISIVKCGGYHLR